MLRIMTSRACSNSMDSARIAAAVSFFVLGGVVLIAGVSSNTQTATGGGSVFMLIGLAVIVYMVYTRSNEPVDEPFIHV